ncbi:MAG TPA: hypothetical protein EYQ08_02505 [Planctomycetes bacterium]|nr:hypothetical protein [Planctomycetota bacterium]HIK81560.1 hypothetical protein [Planctomycetota bacterium]
MIQSKTVLRPFLCFLALLIFSGCGAGGAGLIRLRAENWQPTPGGSIQASDLANPGSVVDLDGVLGLDGEETFWVYGVEADMGVGTYEMTEISFTGNGSTTLGSAIDFGGTTFGSGTTLDSALEATVTTFHSKGALLGVGPVMLKYIWGVDHLVFDTTLTGTNPVNPVIGGGAEVVSAHRGIDEWVPAFGLGAQFAMPIGNDWSLELDGELSGLWISYGDIDGTYEGLTLRGGIRQGSGILFGAGHRSLVIDVSDDGTGTSADIDLGGSFLFVEWAF